MGDTTMGADVQAEADRLYQLDPDAFVEARNALAARLKTQGNREGAGLVKALPRPSVPAWAANQVYWTARREYDLFLASGERLRKAQVQGAAGTTALREAMKARREALDLVLRTAAALLAAAGHGATPETLRRVSNTLEALAADGVRPTPVRAGRLAKELEPPGFDVLAGLAGVEGPAPADQRAERELDRTAPPSAEAVIASTADNAESLRAALAEAEGQLDRARRAARAAAGALSVAEKRAEAARGELEEASRRFDRAQERAAITREDEALARARAEELSASADAAQAERDAAFRALGRVRFA
jgi:hypothetical protein